MIGLVERQLLDGQVSRLVRVDTPEPSLDDELVLVGSRLQAQRLLNSAIPALLDDQPHARGVPPGEGTKRTRDRYMRGAPSPQPTQRQMDVLAAFVAAG